MLAQVISCFARQGTRFCFESALWPRFAYPCAPSQHACSGQPRLHRALLEDCCTALLSALCVCTRFVLSLRCTQVSVAALPSKHSAYQFLPRTAQPCHAMATSTALKAFLQAPREQRVTALRSLGAERMAQLEGELREARLTLFGPMPSSKASKASPPPVDTVPPPKPCPAQPLPPKEEPIPAPPKDPPTPRGPPPRDGTPHRERQAARGSGGPCPATHCCS